MTRFTSKLFAAIMSLALVLLPAVSPAATISSNTATISLSATVPSSLTVSVSVSALNFTTTAISAPVTVSTGWNLAPGPTQINTTVFFNSNVALSSASTGASIPTAQFFCIVNGGTPAPATQTQVLENPPVTFPNTCGSDFSVNLTSSNLSGSNNSTYQFQIPSLMAFTPASDYVGTINVQAFAW